MSCHDNLTLWDKLAISNADDSEEDRIKMNKLASAIVFTSQGVPFFQAGEEMLRSKPSDTSETGFDENSYCSSDATNSLKWDDKGNVMDVYEYYKGLIAFRKAHGAFRMTTAEDVQNNLTFVEGLDANVVAYTIENSPNGEIAEDIFVIYNGNADSTQITLPEGKWDIYVNGEKAGCEVLGTAEGTVTVEGISAMVLTKGTSGNEAVETAGQNAESSHGILSTVLICAGVVLGVVAVVVIVKKKKGQKKD